MSPIVKYPAETLASVAAPASCRFVAIFDAPLVASALGAMPFDPYLEVLRDDGLAHYFSRAPIPWWRDGFALGIHALPNPAPLRHIGIYGYRVESLRRFPQLPQAPMEVTEALEQLRAMWHGWRIAVHVTDRAPGPGVDTPEDLERVRRLIQG